MHDVMRSFAEFMARKESVVIQDNQIASDSLHRMSVGPSNLYETLLTGTSPEHDKIRHIKSRAMDYTPRR
jgi:hypothetical protein